MKKILAFILIILLPLNIYMSVAIHGYNHVSNEVITETVYHSEEGSKPVKNSFNKDRILIKVTDKVNESIDYNNLFMYDNLNENLNLMDLEKISLSGHGVTWMEPVITVTEGYRNSYLINEGVKPFSLFRQMLEKEKYTWYIAGIKPGTDILKAVEEIAREDWVIAAEPDYIFSTQGIVIPNVTTDPKINEQWHIEYSGIRDAWEYLDAKGFHPGGSRDVIVAVIDTGVDYTHPDLGDNMWINLDEVAGNGIDDDGNGFVDDIHGVNIVTGAGSPMDTNGHGTHVAGIIAAVANNNQGGAGIAFNVQIMAINVFHNDEISSSDIVQGIQYAVDKGADIINMSFGGESPSLILKDVLLGARETAVLVAAAGNEGVHNEPSKGIPLYPAAYPWVIGVMAQRQYPAANGDYLTDFSNWDLVAANSYEYEVMAPGINIYSTYLNGMYAKASGTSMATPVVSGIVALMRSVFVDKHKYDTDFITEQIITTGELKKGITYAVNKPSIYYNEVNAIKAFKIIVKLIAIEEAIEAINYLPEIELLKLKDKDTVDNARSLVELAVDEGAMNEDISNLEKLVQAELRIEELQTQLNEAIQVAEEAIADLPDVILLVHENDVIEARTLVDDVLNLNLNVEVFGIERLEEAEAIIVLLKEQKIALEIIIAAETAITTYEAAPITNLEEIEEVELLEEVAKEKVELILDEDIKLSFEVRIDVKKAQVDLARKNFEDFLAEAQSQAEAELAVEEYEALIIISIEQVIEAESLEANARIKVEKVTDEQVHNVLEERINDYKKVLDAIIEELEKQKEAENAVLDYKDAPITSLEDIKVAELLEEIALVKVALVQDEEVKSTFEDIIATKKLLVEEAKIALDNSDVLYGDVNSDGYVTNIDLILLRRYIAGIEGENFDTLAADVNGDGKITNVDLILLSRYLAGAIDGLR